MQYTLKVYTEQIVKRRFTHEFFVTAFLDWYKCCYKLADYQIFIGVYTFVLSDIYEYLYLRIVAVYDIIPMKARDFYGFEKKSI